MANFTYSALGLALTKHFEGLRLAAYQDQGGVWTIGYGHTGQGVREGLVITQEIADGCLESDVAGAVRCVNAMVTVDLQQWQFDALVDFAFNLGCANLAGSTLLRLVNVEAFEAAEAEFLRWNHVGGVVIDGLTRRRTAEMRMFMGLPS